MTENHHAVGRAAAQELLSPIAEDLALVEAELNQASISSVAAITEIGQYLQASGGKRIRPALVLVAAHLAGCGEPTRIRLAAIVEMIHAATLIHDDIIDGAPTRRGRPSTNARWGNPRCVLAGDWLYMQAFRQALQLRSLPVLDTLIALTQEMVEGELMQLEMLGRIVGAAQHRELIRRKTARLFEVSAQLGALAMGEQDGHAALAARLGCFGHHLGMAFQMVDDILDFTASSERLGKPSGSDLREGKMTLPAIYAWEAADSAERERLAAALRGEACDVLPILQSRGGLEHARAESRREIESAQAVLATLPDSPWRSTLAAIAELVLSREN